MKNSTGVNIVIANRKGGVGKSTLATNISVELSRRYGTTLLIDVDASKTSYKFMTRRAECELINDENLRISLPETIDELDDLMTSEGLADYKVVDVGGYSDGLAVTAIFNADLLIVPLNNTQQDEDTTEDFIETIKDGMKSGLIKDCIFVLNHTHPLTKFETLAKEVEYVRTAGFDLYGAISTYKIFSLAHKVGQSVCELNEHTKASEAIDKFITVIAGRLDGR